MFDLNRKVAILKAEQNKIIKLQVFKLSCFRDKSHFKYDGMQNYLVFYPVKSKFKKIANCDHILAQTSKGFSDQSVKRSVGFHKSIGPTINYINNELQVKSDGKCLKEDPITYQKAQITNQI